MLGDFSESILDVCHLFWEATHHCVGMVPHPGSYPFCTLPAPKSTLGVYHNEARRRDRFKTIFCERVYCRVRALEERSVHTEGTEYDSLEVPEGFVSVMVQQDSHASM